MDCITTICLYLKDYISDEQFENIFWEYVDDYRNVLEEEIYFKILFSHFDNVENMIETERDDILAEMLKERYMKGEITIDCSDIDTPLKLINAVKKALQYPSFCGKNWDAIEDLLDDVILPQKLCFSNWEEILRKIPQDADILSELLEKHNNGRSVILYA